MFVLAVLFFLDAVQSHGRVQAGWYRWQLPAELGLHSQMEDDRELLPARIHLPHHLCWEGDQLHTKLKAWQLGLIPSVAPNSSIRIPADVGVLSPKPDLGSSLGALHMELGAVEIPSPVEVSSQWYWSVHEFKLGALLPSRCRQNPRCWALQLLLAAEGCPSVQGEKPSALTHCSTTSYFWQKPAEADSEDPGRTEHLQ